MFDEIRDFVVKNKIWFIICGIIFAIVGAVMAYFLLYFLIVVVVGLIVAVASGFMKNEGIQDLKKYKEKTRKRITREYVQQLLNKIPGLFSSVESVDIDKKTNICSSLIKRNGFNSRGDEDAYRIIWTHFSTISIKSISKNFNTVIRGDIEVLFEVLTGVEWNKVEYTSKNSHCLTIASELSFDVEGHGSHDFSKCFFEHTILCACALYQNRKLPKYSNLDFIPFYSWDENHKHGSVLKQPETDTLPDQNLSK